VGGVLCFSIVTDLITTTQMYDLYCYGFTLQQVADRYGVSNQTVQKRFKRQGLPTRGHYVDMAIIVDRFWSKVDKSAGESGCWLWTAYRDKNGYGWVRFRGKRQAAHRVSYEITFGESPGSVEVDHRCINPSCVNPAHLRRATRKQNSENHPGAQCNSSTGVRGVYRNGSRFMARVQHHGEVFHLGMFDSIEEADMVVRAKRLELFTHNEADKAGASFTHR
jgi:HNH endonuclease